MKIWFDICHMPHVPFLAPQIKEIQNLGHQTVVTVRDRYQLSELCDKFGLEYTIIGKHYGKYKLIKIFGLIIRAFQLFKFIKNKDISIAVTKGSPYQILVARCLKKPSIYMEDYEHSITRIEKHATKIFSPRVVPDTVLLKKGIDLQRVIQYPGLKEDVYLHDFKPDKQLLYKMHIKPDQIIVTIRPPAADAHYQNPNSVKIYSAIIPFLLKHPAVTIILLPRSIREKEKVLDEYQSEKDRIVIPSNIVNGLDLIWHSDLVIGGGGTMNREAAAMGIPVYTIFQGQIGAVDRYLEKSGRLTFIDDISAISKIQIKKRRKKNINVMSRNDLKTFFVTKILLTPLHN